MGTEVSVVVPVYNVEKYIEKCIRSLLEQDCDSIEFIIVDDGSPDDSISICKSVIGDDSRFKIISKPNGGLMSAWKAGVMAASGNYIGFVDSDDWVDPDMFSRLLSKARETGADVVCAGLISESDGFSIHGQRDREYVYSGAYIRSDFIPKYCCSYFFDPINITISRVDKLYKKALVLNNMPYFDDGVSLGEDFNANIAMFPDAEMVVLMSGFYPYHYRDNPTSIVNAFNPRAFDNIEHLCAACKKISLEKSVDSFYIDAFIGGMIFEEAKKICSIPAFDRSIRLALKANLRRVNASFYMRRYTHVRNKASLRIYSFALEKGWIGILRIMNFAYNALARLTF